MASKNFERLQALTAGIAPTKDPISQPGRMKTAPGAMMEVALQRDEAESKLVQAEARIAALEAELSEAKEAGGSSNSQAQEATLALEEAKAEVARLRVEYEAKAAAQVAALEEELRKAKETGGALEIPLERLVEIPGRRRKLTAQEYADLKDNLTHNDLATPITVRPHEDGTYEIVSGNNRVAIYRELGRASIEAWPRDVSDDQAEDMAFFANAMAAKLPDYAKFLGYKRFISKHPEIEQQELAVRAGISKGQLSKLMKFEAFSDDAQALLSEHPWLIGAATAISMAKLFETGNGAHVTAALKKLAAGELSTEAQALAAATKASKPPSTVTATQPIAYKLGKSIYAEQRLVKKTLRIDFASEEEAQAINVGLKELIEQRLAALKAAK